MEISNKEILRYLGYRNSAANERVSSIIAELIGLFSENVTPKSVYGVWDCHIDSSTLTIGNITFNSKNLCGHLADCQSIVLLAATFGTQADALIRRFSVQDMEKAVIAQAVCAAMIEAYCDSIIEKIESDLSQMKEFISLYPTTRFSPGYGDFDIAHQKDILNILNCSRIGLALTEGYMLTPAKSLTAVIGLSKEKKRSTKKCGYCADTKCKIREVV